jgi:hypothetical protein
MHQIERPSAHSGPKGRWATRLTLLTLSSLTLGGLLLSSPGNASTAGEQARRPRPVGWTATSTGSQRRHVSDYWTWSRMRAARSFDMTTSPARMRRSGAQNGAPTTGRAVAIAPTTGGASIGTSSRTTSAQVWPGTGLVARTSGRVFFTIASGPDAGRNASCSGSAVTSANRSVVITAGHCVHTGQAFHRNWMFVPGFDNGRAPFGAWVASNLYTTRQWSATEDLNFDVGAAVVAPRNGRDLVDVVGGQGIAFNQARGRQMYAFGYPAAPPFDGSRLIFAAGRTVNDGIGGSRDIGLRNAMTGGSSGGPWFLGFDERSGAGVLNSVNSFKYDARQDFMFGPFFGDEAEAVYNAAQRQGAQ